MAIIWIQPTVQTKGHPKHPKLHHHINNMTSKLRPHPTPIYNIVYNFANYICVIYIPIKINIIPKLSYSINGICNGNLHDGSFPYFFFGVSRYPLNFLHPVFWTVMHIHPMENAIPNPKSGYALEEKMVYLLINITTWTAVVVLNHPKPK